MSQLNGMKPFSGRTVEMQRQIEGKLPPPSRIIYVDRAGNQAVFGSSPTGYIRIVDDDRNVNQEFVNFLSYLLSAHVYASSRSSRS
ncbi:hypothetical protein FOZ61_005706 [Perkinsus olseni]|uniref:Uncharacterized protein n=1 Tax=Perkinsus olseni TaxID=32597 RepID=A0A7J6LGD5_PEROL|nr:hypothetical protein FOZ61_005706 [Perkinsus olseni]